MKIKSLLIGMLACTALVGCTSEDAPEVNNGKDNQKGDAYVTVKLSMSGNAGSRASFADNKFAEAESNEVIVTKAIFYFLDENGQGCADKYQLGDINNLKEWADGTDNTNIDMTSGAVVVIKNPITTPKSIVALLNVDDPFTDNYRPSLAQIQAATVDMAQANNTTNGFIMTNSVYVNDNNVIVGAPIEAKNIHQSENDVTEGNKDEDEDKKDPVVIPVERVVAKVGMTLPEAGSTFDPNEGSEKYDIRVSIDGWWLTNTSNNSYLVKNLAKTYTNSPFDANSTTKNWWTDVTNKRSYWATMPTTTYTNNGTWAAASATNTELYCLENTDQDEANRTQYVAKATLKIKKEGANDYTAQTFVRWLNEIYTDYDFFQYIANAYNNYVIVSGELASPTIVYDLNGKVVVGAEGTANLTTSIFGWDINTVDKEIEGVKDHEGQIKVTAPTTESGLKLAKVATAVDGKKTYTAVEASKIQSDIRARIDKVLLWLDGQTYYYTDIIHNNSAEDLLETPATETEASKTIPLYGIIRNHLYNLNITGVQGMGTPAPNKDKPITDPTTPEDDEYSHISAQIQILSYKVVPTQNVILGQ